MGKAGEHGTENSSVPFEKRLVGPEPCRYQVGGNISFLEGCQVEIPEFVFDENSGFGLYGIQEPAGVLGVSMGR